MTQIPTDCPAAPSAHCRTRGFTLIELLVVMAIIAVLLSIAVPRHMGNVAKANEAVLRENLFNVRDVLDKFHADTGRYPETLEDLVSKKYLRKLPIDTVTGSTETWIIVPPENRQNGGIYNIRSGAPGKARDGSLYADW
jgi:general secretion pathway protein G